METSAGLGYKSKWITHPVGSGKHSKEYVHFRVVPLSKVKKQLPHRVVTVDKRVVHLEIF